MSTAAKKIFRIERSRGSSSDAGEGQADPLAAIRHQEILSALEDLKQSGTPQDELTVKMIEDYKHDLAEVNKLKSELQRIYEAISRTKQEIATIHYSSLKGKPMARVTDELSAIVDGTEQATDVILQAAETIDQDASNLAALVKTESDTNLVSDIQDQTIAIFEACNFQDLTGQRITKVVKTFSFVEERIAEMIDIWGGLECFKDIATSVPEETEDESLLNGPALEIDVDTASQGDIDALFD